MYYTALSSTGKDMNNNLQVMQYPTEQANTTPQRMLHVIALALDMNPECYRMKTRVRHIVEMRFIASVLLRQHFPALTLQQIAAYFGGQDHSSVINGISRAYNLLHIRDTQFVAKYTTVLQSVTAWLDRTAQPATTTYTANMAA